MLKAIQQNVKNLSKSMVERMGNYTPYVGYHDNTNLGDVELFNLVQKYTGTKRYSFRAHRRGRYSKFALGHGGYCQVGGGTLMFADNIWKELHFLQRLNYTPIFLGTGVGATLPPKDKYDQWKEVLLKSEVYVRGQHSQQMLQKMDIESEIVGDLAYLANLDEEGPQKMDDYVIIIPRSIRPSNYPLFAKDFQIRDKLGYILEQLIEKGIKVRIFSASIDDHTVARGWAKLFPKVPYLEYNNNYAECMSWFKQARLIVSMRMHPGILAFSFGVKPIELDSRVKYFDSFSVFPQVDRLFQLIPPESHSKEEILAEVLNSYNNEQVAHREERFQIVRELALKQQNFCLQIGQKSGV